MKKKSTKKQLGGLAKSDATSRKYIPKAKILNTDIDLNSLSQDELSIPGVQTALKGSLFSPPDPDQAKALVWLKRNNGNPQTGELKAGFKGESGRAYFQNNKIYSRTPEDYLAELAHASQVLQGDYTQDPITNLQEYINPEEVYNLPGSIENNAHQVIQPKLQSQYESLKMSKKVKNDFLKRKLSMQAGGVAPNVRAEKGEVYRDQSGRLNKIRNSAPSHDDPEGGVDLYDVESVLSDSYTQVQNGDRTSDVKENIVKLDPQQVKDLSAQFGVKVNTKKSLSPSKTFESIQQERNKIQRKYEKKTSEDPKGKLAENSYRLNLKFVNELPTDDEIYDGVFALQEANKSMVPELFGEESAQYGKRAKGGTEAVAKYQQMLRDAGYDIATDGAWGAKTQAAYADFQRKAKSRIGGETTPVPQMIGFDADNEFYEKNVDNNLWRANQYINKLDWFDKQNHVYPYLENELPAPAPSKYVPAGTTRTLGTSPWEKPKIRGNVSEWETPVIKQFGGMDDISMQGYRYDSPYQNAGSLMINGGNIDMSGTPQNLALIPVNGGVPDFMGMQVGEAWDEKPYNLGSDQVMEIPMAQYGKLTPEEIEYNRQMDIQRMLNFHGSIVPLGTPYNPRNPINTQKPFRVTPGAVQDQGVYEQLQGLNKPDAKSADGREMTKDKETGFYKDNRGRYWNYDPKLRRFNSLDNPERYEDAETTTPSGRVSTTTTVKGKGKGKGKTVKTVAPSAVNPLSDLKWDLATIDPNSIPQNLPLEEKNTINRAAQTKALAKEWFPELTAHQKEKALDTKKGAKAITNAKKKMRFDFSSPENDLVTAMALGESYQTVPAMNQRVDLLSAQQQFVDPTPYLQEIQGQRAASMQNINPNSSAGQALIAQIDANTQRQTAAVMGEIRRTNNQIDYMNQQNFAQTSNQEQQINNQYRKRYYDENLATQEAARQQRAGALANWSNNASQRRRMINNLKMNAFIAPDFFDYDDLELIGNRNGNSVQFF